MMTLKGLFLLFVIFSLVYLMLYSMEKMLLWLMGYDDDWYDKWINR